MFQLCNTQINVFTLLFTIFSYDERLKAGCCLCSLCSLLFCIRDLHQLLNLSKINNKNYENNHNAVTSRIEVREVFESFKSIFFFLQVLFEFASCTVVFQFIPENVEGRVPSYYDRLNSWVIFLNK